MELRIFILIGLAIQFILFTISRKRSAIFGFVITTFILIYGLIAYSRGDWIELFYIEISQGFFIALCVLWYGFDTYELVNAIQTSFKLNEALLIEETVTSFYKYTFSIWLDGVLDHYNKAFKKEAKLGYRHFIKGYGPYEGGIMEAFLTNFDRMENEFFLGIGERKKGEERGFFVLTNFRLIIKDGISKEYSEILLSDLKEFIHSEDVSKPCIVKLKSGKVKEIHHVEFFPTEAALTFAQEQLKNS